MPVIGSRVGGIPDIVRDGENGLLVPVENPHALADALAAVMGDEARRRSLGAGALRLIEPYGLARFAAELEARYVELSAAV